MERKLDTIQKENKLNEVYAVDEIGPGGAHHKYEVRTKNIGRVVQTIQYQKGPRKEHDSTIGVLDVDLLEMARDRLKAFQAGPFASEYNEKALYHIEEALKWQNKRVEDRAKRNVLGKNEK